MRRLRIGAPLLVALGMAAACAGPEPAQAPGGPVTVFEGARVIVGDGSEPIEDAVFVVQDDRFVDVGPRGQIDVPEGAARVDLAGFTVMPALIDTHKHLSSDRATLIDQLERLAYYGVGVAASLGQDAGETPLQVRDEVIPGAARYRTAGRGITSPEPGRSDVPYWVETVEAARAAVREQAANDVDLIKIWVDDRNGMYAKLTPELYGAVIDEAHAQGLRVTAHIFTLEDAKGLLRAGLDAFAHGVRDQPVDEELLALLRERPDVILAPNLPDRGVATDLSWLSGSIPADELAGLQANATDRPPAQQAFQLQARNLVAFRDAGTRIAFGTDGGVPWAAHVELVDMVAAGLTPAEVIVAATRNSAELLQLDDTGTIEAGRIADFIVLTANPLDDIANTRSIADVYLRGAAVDRDALRARFVGGVTE